MKKEIYYKFTDGSFGLQTVDVDEDGNYKARELPGAAIIDKTEYDTGVALLQKVNTDALMEAAEKRKAKVDAVIEKYPELEGIIV